MSVSRCLLLLSTCLHFLVLSSSTYFTFSLSGLCLCSRRWCERRTCFHFPMLEISHFINAIGVLRFKRTSLAEALSWKLSLAPDAEYICIFQLPKHQGDSMWFHWILDVPFFSFPLKVFNSNIFQITKMVLPVFCLEKPERRSGKGQSAVFILACRCVIHLGRKSMVLQGCRRN